MNVRRLLAVANIVTVSLVASMLLTSCPSPSPAPAPAPAPVEPTAGDPTVFNATGKTVMVNVAFSSSSTVLPTGWSFCQGDASAGLSCTFSLAPGASQALFTGGSYLNATLAFDGQVTCGTTQVELNVNDPSWYDTVDISLVNGFSNKVSVIVDGVMLGPVLSASGNEKVYGVYPLGCDLCTARSASTPCGMTPGSDGCKSGSQYKPDVPCQHQGAKMGGGSKVLVTYLASN